MTTRFATDEEIANWDSHILAGPDGGNVFASFEYAEQKKSGGYTPLFLFVGNMAVMVHEKNALPLGKLWYLPKGPEVTSTKELFAILKDLKTFAAKHSVFAIRIEPELPRTTQPTLARHGLLPARPIIPNPSTITLDISPSLDDILMSLPQKGRHAIRRAERDGVTVELVQATDKNCLALYKLLAVTAEGQFGIRSYEYYRSFWQRFEKADLGQIFFAYVDGKIVAGAFAMVFGTKSTYLVGASIRKRTVYGASHLLQWHVIQWAKSKGSLLHDFCGSPPSDEINNPDHPHHGIGQFKTAFNKTVTDYVGCYDLVIRPIQYKAWTLAGERIVRRLHYYKHHDSYY
ncbi:peptidoglycan bridge formation glycyltransferase FemA/FemB family protein [Patescibacteria group bacterium]|nr:MAG: peptidoglycan bridge formation glycyltransferase FemA/FemB family protein [Patescibacteria group bacterium]